MTVASNLLVVTVTYYYKLLFTNTSKIALQRGIQYSKRGVFGTDIGSFN